MAFPKAQRRFLTSRCIPTETDRRRSGRVSAAAKRGLDVIDRVIERRKPRDRGRSGRGAKIGAPVGFAPAGGVCAFSVASRGGPLAIEDQIGREPGVTGLGEDDDGREGGVVGLGFGHAGDKQGFVVAGEAGDSGDRAVQGGEAAAAGAMF